MENPENSKGEVVVTNIIWRFLERSGSQVVSLVVSIILARLLSPSEYAPIALVAIFITLADVFIHKGLGTALIQKQTADRLDYSSVFFSNLVLSLILYVIIFLTAPFLAGYFNMPVLKNVMRVLGVQVIVAGISSVVNAYVAKHMMFKKVFVTNLAAVIISAFVGIAMAMMGYGVWALVAQQMVSNVFGVILLICVLHFSVDFKFSMQRVRALLPFGIRILISGLVDVGFREIRKLIIGKKYSPDDLAYFNKGATFPQTAISTINVAISTVMFPALAEMQNDHEKLLGNTRLTLRITAYIYFPIMAGLFMIAPLFISILLTDKWMPCVPYLQVYCIEYASWCIQTTFDTALRATGASKIILRNELIRKFFIIIGLLICMNYGMTGMIVSVVLGTVINTLTLVIVIRKAIGYKISMQMKDLFPSAAMTGIMIAAVWLIGLLPLNILLKMILQIITGMISYFAVSVLFKTAEWKMVKTMLFKYLKPRRK